MEPEETKRLVAKSENAAVEFKRARGGVKALPGKGHTACGLLTDRFEVPHWNLKRNSRRKSVPDICRIALCKPQRLKPHSM